MEYRSLVTFGGLEESYYTRYCIDGLLSVRILWQGETRILQISAIYLEHSVVISLLRSKRLLILEKIGSKPKNVVGLTRTVHLNFTLQV